MRANTKLNRDPEILKIKLKDDEIEELEQKTEKHSFKNILKSLKTDEEYYARRIFWNK